MGKINKENAHRLANEVGFVRDYQALIGGDITMVVTIDGLGDHDVLTSALVGTYDVVVKLQRTVDGIVMPVKMLDGIDYATTLAATETGAATTAVLTATTVNFTNGVFSTVLTVGGTAANDDTIVITPADITDLGRTVTAASAVTLTAVAS